MIRIETAQLQGSLAFVGAAMGHPRVWPVVIEHPNGFEPAILHEVGGEFWRNPVPYRMALPDAGQWARNLASGASSTGKRREL